MLKVLVVDDETMIREELKESLEFEDFNVATAATAIEALELCDSESFDVIVTDLKMPKMSGLELLEHLKNRRVQSRVYVVSGHGAETNREEAMRLGAMACLSKPLDVDDLLEHINNG